MKTKIIELLEKTEYLHEVKIGKDFSNRTQKSEMTKHRHNNLDFSKINNYYSLYF